MDIVLDFIAHAFKVLFTDFQIPFLGISLGAFIFGVTMLHFLISLFLPFVRGSGSADKSDKGGKK